MPCEETTLQECLSRIGAHSKPKPAWQPWQKDRARIRFGNALDGYYLAYLDRHTDRAIIRSFASTSRDADDVQLADWLQAQALSRLKPRSKAA